MQSVPSLTARFEGCEVKEAGAIHQLTDIRNVLLATVVRLTSSNLGRISICFVAEKFLALLVFVRGCLLTKLRKKTI